MSGGAATLTLSSADATSNNLDLTAFGSPGEKSSSAAIRKRWGLGYDFTSSAQYLERTGSAGFGLGMAMSAFVAFWPDALGVADQSVFSTHAGVGNPGLEVQVTNTRTPVFFTGLHVFEASACVSGALNRVWVSRDGAGNARIRVNNNAIQTVAMPYDISFATALTVAREAGGTEPLDGGVFELRLWNQQMSDAVLNKIADPNDFTYAGILEGSERAAYLMEAWSFA